VPFAEALRKQLEWVEIKRSQPQYPDLLWLLSHPPVITIGASQGAEDELLHKTDIPVHRISRGGSITYHDPGQITGYLIFRLDEPERDLRNFLRKIETSLIETLNHLIDKDASQAHRVPGKTGVFLGQKKICSIGTACRHWITYHGFSMNFESNLENYKLMNPCGMEAEIMGNISELTEITRKDFLQEYPRICAEEFNLYSP
jgi:lipoyl(octanoyl) transferase